MGLCVWKLKGDLVYEVCGRWLLLNPPEKLVQAELERLLKMEFKRGGERERERKRGKEKERGKEREGEGQ